MLAMVDLRSLPPLLLPAPRQIELHSGAAQPVPQAARGGLAALTAIAHRQRRHGTWLLLTGEDRDRGDQSYRLRIAPGGTAVSGGTAGPGGTAAHVRVPVLLSANSAAGERHGLATLAQLIAQYGDAIPPLFISDAPAFAVRGVMLDVSRDRIPTMAELRRLIPTLAGLKVNHLQFYTEHTFAYRGHDAVWRRADPLTADELGELHCLAANHGIALAANQNCFGHLERWFAQPGYADLAEIAPGAPWDFAGIATKRGGFSLCPGDPRSLALVQDLLGQLLPHLPSDLVNIGCDETYDLGQGRSRPAVAERGRAAVYLEFVSKVCAIVRRHGRRPAFWADIALEHPEALAELPSDLLALVWGYEGDSPFAKWLGNLRGRAAWVCPGTSCWRSITGRTAERRANLLAAATDGLAHGARGFLVTAWGDLGHRQQWPITWHGLVEGIHRAWSGAAPSDHRAVSLHAHGDRELRAARWLDDLGDTDRELRLVCGRPGPGGASRPLRNATALFTDFHRPLSEPRLGHDQGWRDAWEYLLPLRQVPSGLDHQQQAELEHTWQWAALAIRRALLRGTPLSDDQRQRLRDDLVRLREQHRTLWLARSRPGGLDDSCAHFDPLLTEVAQ